MERIEKRDLDEEEDWSREDGGDGGAEDEKTDLLSDYCDDENWRRDRDADDDYWRSCWKVDGHLQRWNYSHHLLVSTQPGSGDEGAQVAYQDGDEDWTAAAFPGNPGRR